VQHRATRDESARAEGGEVGDLVHSTARRAWRVSLPMSPTYRRRGDVGHQHGADRRGLAWNASVVRAVARDEL